MKNIIESPYNDGKAILKHEEQESEFRKEKFHYKNFYYQDELTGLKFKTPELSDLALNQIYNQYRERKKIPSVEQIINLRKKYGLPASKISEILGFGPNTYSSYEKGEIPSEANGELLRIANNEASFRDLFLKYRKDQLKNTLFKRLNEEIENLIAKRTKKKECFGSAWNLWNDEIIPEEFTGYRAPMFRKFSNMVLFFIHNSPKDMFATRLNKLLFYSDFSHYRNTCFSISGASYHANKFGTVPVKSQVAFSIMVDYKLIDAEPVFENDKGEPVVRLKALKPVDIGCFSDSERDSMFGILKAFDHLSTKELVDLNHKEKAWKEHIEGFRNISYQKYAFNLKGIEK